MATPTKARFSEHEPYSNLEVAPTEHAADAPEIHHDPDSTAPERDFSSDSPELDKKHWPLGSLSPGSPGIRDLDEKRKLSSEAPETGALDGSFPRSPGMRSDDETLKEAGKPGDNVSGLGLAGATTEGTKDHEEPQRKKRRGALFWLLIALIALVILGIALGVGLGVGLTRNKSSSAAASSSSSSSSPTPPPVASGTVSPHGLQNDTSVAVIALPNGDKRLFFQETEGNIREALYTNTTGNWSSNTDNIVATNAKTSTPISALLVNNTGTSTGSTGTNIYLFYIAPNNQIASKIFVSGTWTSRDNFSPNQTQTNATFTSTPDSRALAITTNTNSSTPGAAFVFYVASNGSAQCLNITPDDSAGIVASPGPNLPAGVQGGHVLALAAGDSSSGGEVRPQAGILTSNGTAWYSLYFTFYSNGSWSTPELQTILVPALPPNQQPTVPSTLTLADAYPITATNAPLPSATSDPSKQSAQYNESLIGDVDIAQVFVPTSNGKSTGYTLFGFWVNGTELAAYTTKNIGLSGAPKSEFPYSRLAGTTGETGSGSVFLYHQVNTTSIAEDVYSTNGGFFTTTYFDVATE